MGSKAAPSGRKPPPPDPRIRVSPGATRRAMRAATTPSRRERASPPPIRPKTDQVFTPANTHHHRTPHPSNHAAHTTIGHWAAPNHGLCPRAPRSHPKGRRPGIQDLESTSLETHRYLNQRYERKGTAFRTPGLPLTPKPKGRPKLASIDPSCCRARDERWTIVGGGPNLRRK